MQQLFVAMNELHGATLKIDPHQIATTCNNGDNTTLKTYFSFPTVEKNPIDRLESHIAADSAIIGWLVLALGDKQLI